MQQKKCKKVEYINNFNSEGNPVGTRILKGLILEDYPDRIKFKTAHREYIIFKKFLISLSGTNEDFVEDDNHDRK